MIRKIISFLFLLSIWACSSQVVKENSSARNSTTLNESSKKKLAQEKFIDGSILEMKGQFGEAVEQYLAALKLDPQPGIYHTIAKNFFRLEKLPNALTFSKRACSEEPDNIEYLTLLASIYEVSHLEDSSATIYEKIIKIDSTNFSAYYNLGRINETKKPSAALILYKKVVDLIGPEWSVLVHIIDINERLGNVSETIKTVEELIQLNPSDQHLQKVLIDSYIKNKQYDEAIRKADESLVSFPDDEGLIELKGNALVQKGMVKEATTEFLKLVNRENFAFVNKVKIGTSFFAEAEKDSTKLIAAKEIFETINKDTSDWQVNAYLGEIEMRQKNDSAAVKYFSKATELAEWNNQVWIRLGGLLFDSKKYKEAIRFMEKASEKFPNDFAINLIYGLSLSSENQHLKAKNVLQNALKINPTDVNALSALGYTLNQLKEDDAALVHLQKALSLDPSNIQVLSITAMINESRKNFTVSDSLYMHALKIDSTNALILNNFAYSLAERKIRLNEALSMSKKAVAKEPKNASFLDTIGWIYFRLGEYKKAKENVEHSSKLEEPNTTILDHLGDIYFKIGDKTKAKNFWKKAFDADSTKTEIKEKIEKGVL